MSGPADRSALLDPGPRAALLSALRRLTIDDLHALDTAIQELGTEKPYRSRIDKGYWLAWYDGPRLTRAESVELDDLFVSVVVAIAAGVTGLDVERFGAGLEPGRQAGLFGDLARLVRPGTPNHPLQHAAIGLIEGAAAPWDPRLGIIACWNVACAVALRRHLPIETTTVLEGAWRRAIGEPPA